MNLVTFAEHVSLGLEKSAGATQLVFEAGRDYVIAHSHFNRLMADEGIRQRLFKWSNIDNRIPNFNVNAKKPGNQKVLIYNGSGGYGDQILTWPFAAILRTWGFDIHVLIDPGNLSCWWGFPWIKALHAMPLQYEEFKMFDNFALFETVVNAEEHQDQLHPLDQMLLRVGVRPESVDPKLRVIRPNFTYLEVQASSIFKGKKLGMYQLAAANPVRCLPPNDSAYMLSKVAEAFPEIHWLALYDKFIPDPYVKAVQCQSCGGKGRTEVSAENKTMSDVLIDAGTKTQGEVVQEITQAIVDNGKVKNEICIKCQGSGTVRPNVQLYNQPILRDLWALTTQASIVIGPDSMMVHVAGSMDIPCVGLWGPCKPDNRVKYYKNHFPVWKKEVCQFSPCFAYAGTFPRYCPPRPNRTVCECLGSIAPANVIEQVKKALAVVPQ